VTDLAALDQQIAATQAELDAAQNGYRSRPRGSLRLGGHGPMQIDREARAHMLDLGLVVDDVAIRLEDLKQRRALAVLEQLQDPRQMAAEEAARNEAEQALVAADAAATEARKAFAHASGALKMRSFRIREVTRERERAEHALASARRLREREHAERESLGVA